MNAQHQQPHPSSYRTAPGAQPRTIRRVGTFTLGIGLIAVGIVLMLTILVPSFNPAAVCSFAPVLLILLGLELLYHHFFHRSDLLRYDFLSTLFCIGVICTASVVGVVVPLYQQFGPANHRLTSQVEQQLREELYRRLEDSSSVLRMDSLLYINSVGPTATQMSYRDLQYSDHLRLTFTLDSLYQDGQAFAQGCREVLDDLQGLEIPNLEIQFTGKNPQGDCLYQVELPDRFSQGLPAQRIAALTRTTVDGPEPGEYPTHSPSEETVVGVSR